MWYLILTVIVLLLYFLEAIIFLPLLLLFTIANASLDNLRAAAVFAFISGMLMDIGSSRPLGVSSLFLVVISFLVQLYRRRFREESLGFLLIAGFVGTNIFSWVFLRNHSFYIIQGVFSGIIVILFVGLLDLIMPKKTSL